MPLRRCPARPASTACLRRGGSSQARTCQPRHLSGRMGPTHLRTEDNRGRRPVSSPESHVRSGRSSRASRPPRAASSRSPAPPPGSATALALTAGRLRRGQEGRGDRRAPRRRARRAVAGARRARPGDRRAAARRVDVVVHLALDLDLETDADGAHRLQRARHADRADRGRRRRRAPGRAVHLGHGLRGAGRQRRAAGRGRPAARHRGGRPASATCWRSSGSAAAPRGPTPGSTSPCCGPPSWSAAPTPR